MKFSLDETPQYVGRLAVAYTNNKVTFEETSGGSGMLDQCKKTIGIKTHGYVLTLEDITHSPYAVITIFDDQDKQIIR